MEILPKKKMIKQPSVKAVIKKKKPLPKLNYTINVNKGYGDRKCPKK